MLKVAIIQLKTLWHDKRANFAAAEAFIKDTDAELCVLPELFSTGFTMDVATYGETMAGDAVQWFKSTSEKYGKAIMGSVIITEDGKYFNRMFLVTPDGGLQYYNKRHLFRMGAENTCYTGGQERKIFEYNGVRIMPQICYDLRFPVFSRTRGDYDMLIYSACWPEPRTGAWSALLRARAIENQCYVVGVNMVGNDPKLSYAGASAVINYKGETIAELVDTDVNVATAEISLEELTKFREGFPAWMDSDEFTLL